MTDRERAIEELERLYSLLPTIECKGLCWNSCGPIDMSDVERERIEEQGVHIEPFTQERALRWAQDEPLHCSALTEDKKCSVYDVRPLICRLWGVAESMPCTYGCKPNPGYVRDEDAMQAIAYSVEVGGGEAASASQVAALLEDPEVAPLIKRLIRGDRSVEPELIRIMETRRA